MRGKTTSSQMLGIAAGLCTAAIVGTAVSCSVRAATKTRTPSIKKSAKKALKNVEHYIDSLM